MIYCGECGSKNQKDSLFCENCGSKLEHNENDFKEKRIPKKLTKTQKIIMLITLLIIGIFVILYLILSKITSPEAIAKKFMKDYTSSYSNLYNYLDLDDDTTFASKEIFKELVKDELGNTDINNYKITGVTYSPNNLIATVKVSYTKKGSNKEYNMDLRLNKDDDKKWLFFDDWEIAFGDSDNIVVEDYEIVVPKNAKITFAGIQVDKRYLDDDTDNNDVYELPLVFNANTKIKIELENGYIIEDNIKPSNYNDKYVAKVSLNTISDSEKKKITETIKKDLTTIYDGVINHKSFDEIKTNLNSDTKEVKEEYDELLKTIDTNSNTLTSIEFTDITLSNISLDDNNLKFKFKANYKYNIKYKDYSNKEQTKEKNTYSYMEITYKSINGTYNMVDIDDLEDYFSRY